MQAAASTAPAILAAARRHAPARKRGYRRRSRAACVVIRAAPGPLFDVTAAPGAGRCAPDPRPDAPADAPTSSPAAPTEEMAPALPEPEQLPPPELAAEPPAKPKRGRPPGSKRPAQASASNPSHCGRASSSIGGNTSEVWCSQERYANAWSAGAGGAGPRRALRLRRASLATREGLEGDFGVDFWEVMPIERSRRALFGVLASFFFAREAFFVLANVN